MREIGSEFWDIPMVETPNDFFSKSIKWFISGTSALEYILEDAIRKNSITKAAIPSWCCDCLIKPFFKRGIEVHFYPVYREKEGNLILDFSDTEDCDISIVMSYFGYTCQKRKGKPHGLIINDTTHSIFNSSRIEDCDYYFGSLRKWAGFWTGGYAMCNSKWDDKIGISQLDSSYELLRKNAMEAKTAYIDKKHDSKQYLEVFEKAESFLETCGIMRGASRDIIAAQYLAIDYIRNRRRKNASILLSGLHEIALFPFIEEQDCPMFVPIILEHSIREKLRKFLINNDIYCPVHWPISQYHYLNKITEKLYYDELSLVCDQRYCEEDMEHIIHLINLFFSRHI